MKAAASEGWNDLTPEKIESIIEISPNSFLAQFTDDSVTMNLQEMFFDHTFLEAIAELTDSSWDDYARDLAERKADRRLPWLYKNLLDCGAFSHLMDSGAITSETRSNEAAEDRQGWQWISGTGNGGRAVVSPTPRMEVRRDSPSITSFTPRTAPSIIGSAAFSSSDVENDVEIARDVNGFPIRDSRTRNGCPDGCVSCANDREAELRRSIQDIATLTANPPVLRSGATEIEVGEELAPGMRITAVHDPQPITNVRSTYL